MPVPLDDGFGALSQSRRAPSRRDFLQTVLGGVAAAAALPPVARAQTHHAPLNATTLNDTVHVIDGAGGNVVVVIGPDALVMINGGRQETSAQLLNMVAEHSGGKKVIALFNTDWHPEHTGSNEALGKAGTEILAHENTRQYLANDLFVDWQKRSYKAQPAAARPTKTFYTTGAMTLGRERIEYGHLGQAHTDGDIYVFMPGSNVLVAGDVLAVGKYPIADYNTGGWLGGMVTATKTLIDLSNADTRIVPGMGPVQTRADLQAQYDMLNTLRDRLAKMMRQGMGTSDMLAAGATKEFDEKWGSPKEFLPVTYRGMWLHVRELGGIV